MYILTEYHMRSDNMSVENRLLIAALKMSQMLSCGAKRSNGLRSHITIPSESLEKMLVADMIVYHVCVLVIAVNCNHRGAFSHGPCRLPTAPLAECVAFNARKLTSTTALTF